MSQTSSNQKLVTELKVSAHLMLLDPGLFCVFNSPGGTAPDPATGLPGVRITRAPATPPEALSISTFDPEGWLGGEGSAALVRVTEAASHVLVTIYQAVNSTQEAPKLQVLRLSEAPAARPPAVQPAEVPQPAAPPAAAPSAAPPEAAAEAAPGKLEVAAHVQRRGDVLTRLGEWMGKPGSQSWIEGFAISPSRFVEPADIEYQAVLGKGWLSPWAEGGAYCGSRGMALPILGLRVRLKGDAAERFAVRVSATFTDGSSVGPVDGTETAEAPSLAPLEAFLIEILPQGDAGEDEPSPVEEAAGDEDVAPPARSPRPGRPAAVVADKRVAARPVPEKAALAKPSGKPALKSPLRAGGQRPALRVGPAGKAGAKGSKGRR